jgi:hypothetical protein
MRDGGGSSIWEADPQKNLMFSVHMYDVYGSSATVTSYFNNFLMNYGARDARYYHQLRFGHLDDLGYALDPRNERD